MPNITVAGTVEKDAARGLTATLKTRAFLFAGSSLGTTCTIEYEDDEGVDRVLENGTITALPSSISVAANIDLKIVTTGSPNFNITIA